MADHHFKKGNQLSKGLTNNGVPKIYTKEYVDSLIPDLVEWSKRDDAIVFNRWIATRGFHQQRCSEFCQISKDFAESYKQAKLLVAMRREELAMQGKLDAGIVKHTMHVYDNEIFQSLIDLKKASQSNDQPTTVNVVLSGRQPTKQTAKKTKGKIKGKRKE